MRVNKNWIDEWVDSGLSPQELSDKITMAGLEVDTFEPVCAPFSKVVVAKVLECVPHPDSDHMHITQVDSGDGQPLQIVCGAANVRAGLKVCCALEGADVNGLAIKTAKLRGVESHGMLCSYKELGMAEESEGIIELPEDAPLGQDVHSYFGLDDVAIEIDLTANRPDCLSVLGVARELSVLTGKALKESQVAAVTPVIDEIFPIEVQADCECPRYQARIIRNVDQSAQTPLWMVERLRRCGIRSVSPIVDVTNYVMLEYGQPLHSFDLDKLHDKIVVRKAHSQEKFTVLSGEELTLNDNTLLICDAHGPVALAGIFGGLNSGINDKTVNVLLESAFFAPDAIKGRARQYGLDTDASHRFERGVDPINQTRAMERATELLLAIAGGQAGPINEVVAQQYIPVHQPILLRYDRLNKLLGQKIEPARAFEILKQLQMQPQATDQGVTAISPSFRFDIAIEEDLIEEIARIYGYNNIPNSVPVSMLQMVRPQEHIIEDSSIKRCLTDNGFYEVITYSFTDPKVLAQLSDQKPLLLTAPISPEMSAMRTTLLAGLVLTAKYNFNRQQKRVRIFEQGLRYIRDARAENGVRQEPMLAGLALGDNYQESWSQIKNGVDFFDIKAVVEQLLLLTCDLEDYTFKRSDKAFLHPGQSADLFFNGQEVGYLGVLHPNVQKALGLKSTAVVFELQRKAVASRQIPHFASISKFPSTRRDFAFVLPKSVAVEDLLSLVRELGQDKLQDVIVFDVFEDASLGDKRSVAIGVVLQDQDRTLEDAEVDALCNELVTQAQSRFEAQLRA